MIVLLANGPNLNLLGQREPEIYGMATLADHVEAATKAAAEHGLTIEHVQSNHEGVLIDALHEAMGWADGALFNPGAFTHYSFALRDAVTAVSYPVIEVHLSLPAAREEFRHTSVIAPACRGQIAGFGAMSYELGLDAMLRLMSGA